MHVSAHDLARGGPGVKAKGRPAKEFLAHDCIIAAERCKNGAAGADKALKKPSDRRVLS